MLMSPAVQYVFDWTTLKKVQDFSKNQGLITELIWLSSIPTKPLPTAKSGCPGPCPTGIWIFPKMETPKPPWAICSSAWHYTQYKNWVVFFFLFRWSFLYFNLCPLPFVFPLCRIQKRLVLSSLYPPTKYLYTLIKLPPRPSFLEAKLSLSTFSNVSML